MEKSTKNFSSLSKLKRLINLYSKRLSLFFQKLLEKIKSAEYGQVDKKLIFSLNKSRIPTSRQLKYVGQFLSKKEKRIITVSLAIILVSGIFLSIRFYINHVKIAPKDGGTYTEGLVGSPKLINPLYASVNNIDNDISCLIYSGLLKRDKDNKLVPDLAEKFEISSDEKEYTFYLRKDVHWHNKSEFTADDVIFTFNAIADSEYKSPLKLSFEGTEIEKIDDYTIKLILNEPYAAFLELLTTGILPQELWSQIPPSSANLAELNLKPIGTGPYKFKSLTKDKAGNIKLYELEVNNKYYDKKPYLQNLTFKFFSSFQEGVNALNEGRIEGIDFLPKEHEEEIVAKNNYTYHRLNQPQLSALFLNQDRLGVLIDKRVRQALAHAVSKQEIIATTSPQYTYSIDGPILPMFTEYYNQEIKKYEYDLAKAKQLLDQAGWKIVEVKEDREEGEDEEIPKPRQDGVRDPDSHVGTKENETPAIEHGTWRKKGEEYLILSLTTVDQPDNIIVAELIKNFWEKLNIKINMDIVSSDLIQNEIIKPRNYQILLYGEILGADPDQYPFWHSSQIGSSGLNLANYNNKKADELLEDARITNNVQTRVEKYKEFQNIIADDLPAIFLYSRNYTYLQDKKIKGFGMTSITIPSDRFNNIGNWYIKTGRRIVW